MKLLYCFFEKHSTKNVDHSIKYLAKERPKWWKSMSSFINGFNNPKEAVKNMPIQHLIEPGASYGTIKNCPAMHNLWQKTVLLKFPCDVVIETYKDGNFAFRNSNYDMEIEFHTPAQVPKEISDNFIMIKMSYNLCFTVSKKSSISFIDPILYKHQEYRVAPGIMNCFPNNQSQLKVILFFPKQDKRYLFEADEPLAMLQFEENVSAVVEDKNLKNKVGLQNNHRKIFRGYLQK
jgi:hypothetical protein